MYLFRLIWPLIAMGYVVNLYQRGTASLKRMNAIFASATRRSPMRSTSNRRLPIEGEIEFRDLTFTLPRERRASAARYQLDYSRRANGRLCGPNRQRQIDAHQS